jgi:hypothetical protein
MDFIPAGYMAIRTAVDHILRTTHSDDWGRQELKIEKDEIIVPGATDDTGQHVKGRPYDRDTIAAGLQQVRDAENRLLSAFKSGELAGTIENGPPVPCEYWGSQGAATTVSAGILNIAAGAQPEDVQWQHRRVLIGTEDFDVWLARHLKTPKPQRASKNWSAVDQAITNLKNTPEIDLTASDRSLAKRVHRMIRPHHEPRELPSERTIRGHISQLRKAGELPSRK